MQVSLNVIGSGSIVFCLVAAVALSVSLSFTSANRHLSDLESYGSESLALCYENVVSDAVDLVRNIMQKKIDKTRTVVVSLLSQFRNMDNTIRQSFADRDGSERVEFYRRLMPLLGAMWNHHDLAYLTVFDETYGVGFIEHSWSAALTVVATMRMVGPLKELEKRMADVAKMRLEGATDLKNTYMTDLRSMQVSFRLMVAALEEYRQFLPASLLARNDTAEIIMTEDAADRRMDLDVMPSPESSPQDMSRNGRAKKYRLENSSSQNSSIAGSNAMPRANTFRNLMRVGLHMKTRVAEVLIGAHDFPQFLKAVLSNSDAAADVAGFLQKYMLGIVPEASAHHGSIVFFKADQVHVDFKGILPCSDVVGKAARFCCAVLANYRKHVNRHEQYFANAHVSLHVGAALVTAFVGNMGTPAMKGIQVIGEGVRLASIMQTVASEMRLGLVANAPFCARLPQLEYTTGPADCVVVESMVYLASAVIEQPRSGAPNWMYRPVQTVDTSFTTAWNFIYAGRLPEGTEKLAHVSLDSDYASLAGQVVKRLTLHRRETSLLGCKAVPQDTDLYRFSEPQLSGDTSPLSSPAASAAFFLLGTCTSQQGLNDSGVLEELETPIFSSGAQALSASAYHRYYVEACTVPSQLADLHDRALDLDQPLESALSSPRTATPRGSSTNMRNGIKRLRIGRGVGSPRLVSNRSQSQSSGTASLASQSSLRVASPCRE
ncbi:hypothetical protein DIPPA_34174 [Diplonema papillatum]|nr:hypothetical protein DIPPA_34174 [Diplonema papillatum]